jgi:hypothetical protein
MEEREINSSDNSRKTELEAEAGKLRRERFFTRSKGPRDTGLVTPSKGGGYRRIVFILVSLVCLLGAVLLLAIPGLRRGITVQMAGVYTPEPDNRLYKLPAPPPKAPNVIEQFQVASGNAGSDDILYSGSQRPDKKIEPFNEKKESVNLQRTPGSRSAFALMEADESLIGVLLKGENSEMEFKTWNLVSQTPPVYLLDIVAEPSGEEKELHLVFSVDMEKKEIVPLSQAARDFMRP